MGLQLHCKRSKMFVRQITNKKTEKVMCPRGETVNVPDWVKGTQGYKMGVQDKSILDLTPPVPAAAPAPAETKDAAPDVDVDTTEDAKPASKKAPRSAVPKGLQGGGTVVETK